MLFAKGKQQTYTPNKWSTVCYFDTDLNAFCIEHNYFAWTVKSVGLLILALSGKLRFVTIEHLRRQIFPWQIHSISLI